MSGNNAGPCIAESVQADFESGEWTFEPVGDFAVGAGRYAIMRESEYQALTQQRDELLKTLEVCKQWHQGEIWRNGSADQREAWESHMSLINSAIAKVKP